MAHSELQKAQANYAAAKSDLEKRAAGLNPTRLREARGDLEATAELYRDATVALRGVIGKRRNGEPNAVLASRGAAELKEAKKELKRVLDELEKSDPAGLSLAGSVRVEAARLLRNLTLTVRMGK